jgi:hypothetical protein
MKIIFLDIDGVLNCENWYRKRHKEVDKESIHSQYPFYEFDTDLVLNLNRIIKETQAKVVVSSTWRLGRTPEELQEILERVGFKGEVIDTTGHLGGKEGYTIPRGCEIDQWLKKKNFQRINWSRERQNEFLEKSEVKNYVILDDDSDMLYGQREHFAQTSWKSGLNEKVTQRAIQILNAEIVDLYYKN